MEDKATKITQSKITKKKINIYVIRIPQGEEKEDEAKNKNKKQ